MTLICLCGYAHEHPVLEPFPRFCARGAARGGRGRARTVGSCAATNGSATEARRAGTSLGLGSQRHFSGQATTH